MSLRNWMVGLITLLALGLGGTARAEEAIEHRLGLGLGVGTPGGGSGIPASGNGGTHLGATLTGRYVLGSHLAVSAGFGVPIASEGVTLWGGAELGLPLLSSPGGAVRWWVYATPGAQLGFTGPGYFARHSHVFVGWEYIYSGPLTPALRLPAGTAVSVAHGRADLFAEALPVLGFYPGVELTFGGLFGARFYF